MRAHILDNISSAHDKMRVTFFKVAIGVVVTVQLGCFNDSPTDPLKRAANMKAVTPQEFSAQVQTVVTPAPTVRVTDSNGNPVAGVEVSFSVGEGAGSVTPTRLVTDAKGEGSVTWTLSSLAGTNTLTAEIGTVPRVVFTARGAAGSIARLAPLTAEYQYGIIGTVMTAPLSVKVLDKFENPISGVAVTFAVIAGDGSIDGSPTISDSAGVATAGPWTLGIENGLQKVHVQAEGAELIFTVESSHCTVDGASPVCSGAPELVFVRGTTGELYSVRLDGSELRRLSEPGRNIRPVWSPDGSRIAFVRWTRGPENHGFGTADVYLMNADGSNVVRRTTGANWLSVAWSPDGRKLAVSDEGIYEGEVDLISVDDDGSPPVLIADYARSPAWSPDGNKIAFVRLSGDDGYHTVDVMDADGSGMTPLTEMDGGGIFGVTWSPDGEQIAFSKCLFGPCALYTMNADGSAVRSVTALAPSLVEWSPDGKWIAVTANSQIAYVSVDGGPLQTIESDGFDASWRPAAR